MPEPRIVDLPERQIAAVKQTGPWSQVMPLMFPSLDKVWALIRGHDIPRNHNTFIYGDNVTWFGVQVLGPIPADEDVVLTTTPAGRCATVTHLGSYNGVAKTSGELRAWCAENGHKLAGLSWEVYGDPGPDESKNETEIYYLLA